jgi:fluoride exporter
MLRAMVTGMVTGRDWLAARSATLFVYAAVAVGSGIGGAGRHLCTELATRLLAEGWPWGTLFVNVAGSFAIGLFAAIAAAGTRFANAAAVRQFAMAGLCGGFTTFSAFSLDTMHLIREGKGLAAGANIALSVVLCLLFVGLGYALAARATPRTRG